MIKNIFEDLNFSPQNELVCDVFRGKNFRIERMLSYGQTTNWQEQDEDEWVCVIDGKARILFEGELGKQTALCFLNLQDKTVKEKSIEILLQKGDTLFIPAGAKHRVSYTSKGCFWLCVFAKNQ
ncbi:MULTISPECIES: hypothetical protein [unclassified Campylobacter]|uniref:hypothetical protein n=1 Tax=unclassified Campylobacter TaxID=2593542 RepID=UPI003D329FAA